MAGRRPRGVLSGRKPATGWPMRGTPAQFGPEEDEAAAGVGAELEDALAGIPRSITARDHTFTRFAEVGVASRYPQPAKCPASSAARLARRQEVAQAQGTPAHPQEVMNADEDGNTPMHHACEQNEVETAKQIIERVHDERRRTKLKQLLLLKNHDGETPIMLALDAAGDSDTGDSSLKLLLAASACSSRCFPRCSRRARRRRRTASGIARASSCPRWARSSSRPTRAA